MSEEIFSIDFNAQQFVENVNKATQALEGFDAVSDELKANFKQTQAAVDSVSFTKPVSEVNELKSAIKQLAGSGDMSQFAKGIDDAVDTVMGDVNKLKKFLADLKKELASLGDGAEFKELAGVIKMVEGEIEKLTSSTKEYAASNQTVKTRLKEVKDEMLKLDNAGKSTSATYKKLQKEAAALTDQLGDQREALKALSSDTLALDATVDVLNTLAAGWQVVEGAMVLAGASTEDVQKSIQRLTAVMNIANGVQQIGAFLTGQSAAKMQLLNIWTKAQAVTQNLLTKAFGASAVAAKGLSAALTGLGVGAIIFGVTLLIEKLSQLSSASEEAKRILDENAAAATSNLKNSYDERQQAVEDWIAQLKLNLAKGVITEQTYNKGLARAYQRRAEIAQQAIKDAQADRKRILELTTDRTVIANQDKLIASFRRDLRAYQTAYFEFLNQLEGKKKAEVKKSAKEETKVRVDAQEEIFEEALNRGREAAERYYTGIADKERELRNLNADALPDGVAKEVTRLLNEQADEVDRLTKEYDELGNSLTEAFSEGAVSLTEFQNQLIRLSVDKSAALEAITKRLDDAILSLKFANDQDFGLGALDNIIDKNNELVDTLGKVQATEEAFDQQANDRAQERQQINEALFESIKKVWEATLGFLKAQADAEEKAYAAGVRIQQQRVDAALRIAENGNAEYLQLEEDRLIEVERKREAAARRQLAIDSALQASQILLGVAGAVGQIATGGTVGVIKGIATILAAIAASGALIKSLQANQPKFFVGSDEVGRDVRLGSDRLDRGRSKGGRDTIAAMLHEGEAVIQTDKNKLYQPTVQAIRRGLLPPEVLNGFVRSYSTGINHNAVSGAVSQAGQVKVDFSQLSKEMKDLSKSNRDILATLEAMNPSVSVKMDEDGFSASILKHIKRREKVRNA
jgi:hypothetical protein